MLCMSCRWNSILFLALFLQSSPFFFSSTSTEPAVSRQHEFGKILLFKELFTEHQKMGLKELRAALFGGYWQYYDYDKTPRDGVAWQLPLDSSLLSQSPLWVLLNEIIPGDSKQGASEHVDSKARVLRRGDNVKIDRVCSDQETGHTVLLFLSKLQDTNDYGEVLFFENDDVHTTVQPTQFSVLLWSCQIPYQLQYPSISTGFGQVLLQITVYDKVDVKPTYLPHTTKLFPVFAGTDAITQTFRVADHVTTTSYTALNRPVYVLDDLFSEELLSGLREHLYLYSQYYYDDSDDHDQTDNVQWISGHRTAEFVQSEMWAIVNTTLNQMTGHEGWYPYDVSCNLNRAWDHTRIHKDCYDKDEYTFLLYLNPEFQPGDLAGTVFYEQEDDMKIVTSVQNRYGRVALFHCEIQHAARPPHAYLTHARYTFAVKVARNKLEAVQREMIQVVGSIFDFDDEDDEGARIWIDEYTVQHDHDPDRLEEKFNELVDKATAMRLADLENSLVNAGS